MINTLLFLLLVQNFAHADHDLKSCLTYRFGEIKEETAQHVLNNIFNKHLSKDLMDEFPNENINWDNWITETSISTEDDGSKRTYLKGCFVVNDIYKRADLVIGIMRVADKRAKAAFNFYFEFGDGQSADSLNSEKMLEGMERMWRSKEFQEYMNKHAAEHGL